MFKKSDFFFLLAVMISFFVSGYLWFNGQRMEGIFTAIWVPSILGFGIYFKLMVLGAKDNGCHTHSVHRHQCLWAHADRHRS